MIITPTALVGVHVVEPSIVSDERGGFARVWCEAELASHGLAAHVSQCSISINRRAGTLRGMHWQDEAIAPEAKLVRVTAGAIWDVGVDVRPDSPTFGKWVGVELTAWNRRALYLSPGLAHGFITLADDTEVYYQMDTPFAATASRGFRWDDPTVAIAWPATPIVMSPRDRELPLLVP